jgi:ribonuclease HI
MDAQVEGLCPVFLDILSAPLTLVKTNGWRNSSRKIVANQDFFCELDEAISALEARHIDVGFWWIERQIRTE